jgi:heat shock protein HtpX
VTTFKTGLYLAALTGLLLLVGRLLGGNVGLVFALVIAAVMNIGSYWFSDQIVLSMYKAQPVSRADMPELYQVVEELVRLAGMPMPALYVVEDSSPNAFATGRNPEHAAVAVTTGILSILSKEELAGVLAHELCHVQHRDTLISTIAAVVAGAIGMLASLAQWTLILGGRDEEEGPGILATLAMAILAPLMATLIQLAVSRAREYAADEGGAQLTGQPLWLARALQKLEQGVQQTPSKTAHERPATAHLFIINPLTASSIANLLATHPPIEERVSRLEAMVEED